MYIDIKLLIEAFDKIAIYLRKNNLDKIELSNDYYLDFNIDKYAIDRLDLSSLNIRDLCVGSTFDDLTELKREIYNEKYTDIISSVTIDRLAPLLEYISYYINNSYYS